jgi:hypothetical protein
MTIPFQAGESAKALRFERQLEPDDPRSFGPGVSPLRGFADAYEVVVEGISAAAG